MCFAIIDGQAAYLDSAQDVAFALAAGRPVYGSMAGAVYYGGVIASPFDRALRVETLYDARAGLGLDGPAEMRPVGTRAAYRLHALGHSRGIDPSRAVHDPVGADLPPEARLIA